MFLNYLMGTRTSQEALVKHLTTIQTLTFSSSFLLNIEEKEGNVYIIPATEPNNEGEYLIGVGSSTESGQGFERKKPHSEAAQDFFQIRTCEALDRFGVWSYLCRPKREKTQFASPNADWSKDTLFRYDFFKNRYTYGREV